MIGTRPLALTILDGPVADVLRRRVTQNMTRGRGRGDVADPPANNDPQLRFKVGSVVREWDLNFAAIRDERSGSLDPNEGLLGQRFAAFARVIGIIQPDGDNLGRRY